MGKNMKKSKQNVVPRIKDFKKTKVKVGRKLKNIAETLPKVKVAKICVRSQFTGDSSIPKETLLLDDEKQVLKVSSEPAPSLSSLQQLSNDLLLLLKQTHVGKKIETRRDSIVALVLFLSRHHASVTIANFLSLLECVCAHIVDSSILIRTENSKLLRVLITKLMQSKGLSEEEGLDWTSHNFPMLMAYICRGISNNNLNATSLSCLATIFDLCPLVAITTSSRISQLLLKTTLHHNAAILSNVNKKTPQILSIVGNEWSGSALNEQHPHSHKTNIDLCQYLSHFLQLLATELHCQRIPYKEHKENLLDDGRKCLFFAADVIKVMVDVFIDCFYQASQKGKGLARTQGGRGGGGGGGGGGGLNNVTIVLDHEEALREMQSCLHTSLLCLRFVHLTNCPPPPKVCESLNESMGLLTSTFPCAAVVRGKSGGRGLKRRKDNKAVVFTNEKDAGAVLNDSTVSVLLSFLHHTRTFQPHHTPLDLLNRLLPFLHQRAFSPLPHLDVLYLWLLSHQEDGVVLSKIRPNQPFRHPNGGVFTGIKSAQPSDHPNPQFSSDVSAKRLGRRVDKMDGLVAQVIKHASEKMNILMAEMSRLVQSREAAGVEKDVDSQNVNPQQKQQVNSQKKQNNSQLQQPQIILEQQSLQQQQQFPQQQQQSLQQPLQQQQQQKDEDKNIKASSQEQTNNRRETINVAKEIQRNTKEFLFWLKVLPASNANHSDHLPVFTMAFNYLLLLLESLKVNKQTKKKSEIDEEDEEEDGLRYLLGYVKSGLRDVTGRRKEEVCVVASQGVGQLNRLLLSEQLASWKAQSRREFLSLVAEVWWICYQSQSTSDPSVDDDMNGGGGMFVEGGGKWMQRGVMPSGTFHDLLAALVHISAGRVVEGSRGWREMLLRYISCNVKAYNSMLDTSQSFSIEKSTVIKASAVQLVRLLSEGSSVERIRHFKLLLSHFPCPDHLPVTPQELQDALQSFLLLASLFLFLGASEDLPHQTTHHFDTEPPQLTKAAKLAFGVNDEDDGDDVACGSVLQCKVLLKQRVTKLWDVLKNNPTISNKPLTTPSSGGNESIASKSCHELLKGTFGGYFSPSQLQCLLSQLTTHT